MNSSNYRFSLDMHRAKSQISIPVMLGDTNRALHIILSDGGKPYIIEDGFIAKITIKRPTGTHIEDFCAIENNTTIVYQFSQNENTAAVAGLHECDITLYDQDGRIITSPEFSMVVNERILKYDDVTLTDEDFTAVDAMIAKEASRQNNEANRVSAEADRVASETARASAESERSSAEALRISAESERVTAEAGRVQAESQRVAAEAARRAAEADRVSAEAAREVKVNNAVNTSNQAKETATNAAQTANNLSNTVNQSIAGFRAEIGTDALIFGQATVKGAVNHAMNTADIAKNQSDANRSNITNLSAQVNGIGRTYVVATFLDFIDFLNSTKSIPLSEDRDGNGVAELYSIFVSDLKTGDNIIIKETGVPDFWFEKNSSLSSFDKYTYNGKEYTLSAKKNGATVGGSHILETDYTVIEGYALSASGFAVDAANSAARALQSENNAKASYNSAKAESDKAKASEEAAKVSETEAANSASAAHAYLQEAKAVEANMENLSSRISRNDKRITNLEQGIPPSLFQTDDTVAYSKSVPENARSYAMINSIGGITRKCTNLIPFPYRDDTKTENNVTFKNNGDGSITVPATTSTNLASFYMKRSGLVLKAGTYTVSGGANGVGVWVSSGGKYHGSAYGSETFTITETTDFAIYVHVGANTTISSNTTVFPMLNEGSTALPYEPYFEGLRSAPVTEEESVGANLIPYPYSFTSGIYEGVTVVDNGDGSFTLNGTATGTVILQFTEENVVYLPAGTYTSSFTRNADATISGDCYIYLGEGDSGLGVLAGTKTFELPKFGTIGKCLFRMSSGSTFTNYTVRPMLNKGSTSLPYSPYVKHTLPIPESVQSLDGYGDGINESCHNYVDCVKKQFAKNVAKQTFTGTESWVYDSNYHCMLCKLDFVGITSASPITNASVYCTLASAKSQNVQFGASAYPIEGYGYASVNAWKAYLAEQYANGTPITLVYALATPEITDISDILPDDNYIAVEGNGTVTMVNEHGFAVPSEITYQLKGVTI